MNKVALAHLADQAERARTEAARLLAEDRTNTKKIAMQLQALQDYRRDYSLQLEQHMRVGIHASMLATYRAFLVSLDKAITQAQVALSQQQQRESSSQQKWLNKQQRLRSFELLKERQQREENRLAERADQRLTDDMSLTMYQRLKRQ